MKRNFTLFVFVALFCNIAFAQQTARELYKLSFENDDEYGLKDQKHANFDTNNWHYVSYNNSYLVKATKTEDAFIELESITVTRGYTYGYLEFSHICKVNSQAFGSGENGARVEYKVGDNGTWETFKSDKYVRLNGQGVAGPFTDGEFREDAYPEKYPKGWDRGVNSVPTNDCWKKERFDLKNILISNLGTGIKLYIRFRMPKMDSIDSKVNDNHRYGWLIDDISVKVSEIEMMQPAITMLNYPAPIAYPNSDAVKIRAKIVDASGLTPDSVYVDYQIGTVDDIWYRSTGKLVSSPTDSTYEALIPFAGYDTLVTWRLTAVDSTLNYNRTTFPYGDTAGNLQFKSVRSVPVVTVDTVVNGKPNDNDGSILGGTNKKGRHQIIYQSKLLKDKGLSAGNISAISFYVTQFGSLSAILENCNIRMLNLDTSYVSTAQFHKSDDFKTVYSGNLTFQKETGWIKGMISLMNSFQWNGTSDIMLEICYPSATGSLDQFHLQGFKDTDTGKHTTEQLNGDCNVANGQSNAFKPNILFRMDPNSLLQYDAGIVDIISPVVKTSVNTPSPLRVVVKNYGKKVLTSGTVKYSINGGADMVVNWSNPSGVAAGGTDTVTIANISLPAAGFSTIEVCTGDSVNGLIDYEPNNNCAATTLTVCDGALSGDRYIGDKTGQDGSQTYHNFEEAFTMLKNCGISSSVTFYVQDSVWDTQLEFPVIEGLKDGRTITFRPHNDGNVVIKHDLKDPNKKWLVQLQEVKNIIFKNITFQVDNIDSLVSEANIMYLGSTTDSITIDSCKFKLNAQNLPQSVIFSGGASYLTVSNSKFDGKATSFIYLESESHNNTIIKDTFTINGANENAIYAHLQKNLRITQNLINSSSQIGNEYAVNIFDCSDTVNIEGNKIFTTNAQSGMIFRSVRGNTNRSVLVANNMISATGKASYGVNILSASYLKFVYNSVLVNVGSTTSSIALNIKNDSVNNADIYNNILTNNSGGYAISLPNSGIPFNLNYNSYYSTGNFGLYNAAKYNDSASWQSITVKDTNSFYENPLFDTPANLVTISVPLADGGTPVPEVTNDIKNTARTTTPSLGAVQFSAPDFSLAVLGLESPLEGCNLDTATTIIVKIKNVGKKDIVSGRGSLWFEVGGKRSPAEDIGLITSGEVKSFPFSAKANLSVANFQKDSVFNIKIWDTLSGDPYQRDDTIYAQIKSNYQLPKPTVTHAAMVEYNEPDTLVVTHVNEAATYWFKDSLATLDQSIYKGDTLVIPHVLEDTALYVSQKYERPMLRFTELQLVTGLPGNTEDRPNYISDLAGQIIELSNLGDGEINLKGYKVKVNNKIINLPNQTLKGENRVFLIQAGDTLSSDFKKMVKSPYSLYVPRADVSIFGASTPASISLISPTGTVIDGFMINKGTDALPAAVWKGTYIISTTPNVAGIRRINPKSIDSAGWVICNTNQTKGSIAKIEDNMIVYRDNGCFGHKAKVEVKVRDVPNIDLGIDSISVTAPDVCNLGNQPVTVVVHNYGKLAQTNIPVQLYLNGTLTVSDTITGVTIDPKEKYTHTFSQSVNLFTRVDMQHLITATVGMSGDAIHTNDTARTTVNALKSPYPVNDTTLQVTYGTAPLLRLQNQSVEDSIVWYDWNKNPLSDTSSRYQVPFVLYRDTTYYIKALALNTSGTPKYGCIADDFTKVTVHLTGVPNYDLEMVEIVSPERNTQMGPHTITVAIRNNGVDSVKQVALSLYINGVPQLPSYIGTIGNAITGLRQGEVDTITLNSYTFSSGSDTIKVVLDSLSSTAAPTFTTQTDEYPATDVVTKTVSFCLSNTVYTIGGTSPDYPTFDAAVKALIESGICSPVTFKVRNSETPYIEQVSIPAIHGASAVNTITFLSESGDSSQVTLTYLVSKIDSNYVLQLDNASHIVFKGITIKADVASIKTFARAVVVKGDSVKNISFTNNRIITSTNAVRTPANISLTDAVYVEANLEKLLFENNRIEGGEQALLVKPKTAGFVLDSVSVKRNTFYGFRYQGSTLENLKKAEISGNTYYSNFVMLDTISALTLVNPIGEFKIEKNTVSFPYESTNNRHKIGIRIVGGDTISSFGSNSLIANNMISLLNSSGPSSFIRGIVLQQALNIKVIYNTILVRVIVSGDMNNFGCFYSDNSRGLTLLNNNFQMSGKAMPTGGFEKISKAIVLDIKRGSTEVLTCDYNNYYCTDFSFMAKWGNTTCTTLDALRGANSSDSNSKNIVTVFRNDTTNLRMISSDLSGLAVINNDILDDIDGNPRPPFDQALNPTIGAHEYLKASYDVGVIAIVSPGITSANRFELDGSNVSSIQITIQNTGTLLVKESDSVWIKIYVNDSMQSKERLRKNLNPKESVTIPLPSFHIPWKTSGTFSFYACTVFDKDTVNINDTLKTGKMEVRTSYNLRAEATLIDKLSNSGCNMTQSQLGIRMQNLGGKDIQVGHILYAGVKVISNGVVVSNISEPVNLNDIIRTGSFYNYYFKSTIDLYPRGTDSNVTQQQFDIQTYCRLENDYDLLNDTTNGSVNDLEKGGPVTRKTSYKTPKPPTGDPQREFFTDYATPITLSAKQVSVNTRSQDIRWYNTKRDTISKGTTYRTPVLFTNQTYYLNTRITQSPCWSVDDTVKVTVRNRPALDAGCIAILEPYADLAYMEKGDSVKVRIMNYGTQPISNFPVTFRADVSTSTPFTKHQLFTDICKATIQPGDTCSFTFQDSLFAPLYQYRLYKFSIYTNLSGDNTALNDTVHFTKGNNAEYSPDIDSIFSYNFTRNGYNEYGAAHSNLAKSGLKITNVTYGLLNNSTAPLGDTITEFYADNNTNDTSAIFYKGYADTMSITAAYYNPYASGGDSAYAKVYIDWDRNMKFDERTELVFGKMIKADLQYNTVKQLVKIPETAKTGFCKMRVVLHQDGESTTVASNKTFYQGEVEDYKIWVRPAYDKNLILEKVITPSDTIGGLDIAHRDPPSTAPTDSRDVKVLLRNLGKTTVTGVTIYWQYDTSEVKSKVYTESLATFQSAEISLGEYPFPFGTTLLKAWVDYSDNKTFKETDTIKKQFHRFRSITLTYRDNFDANDYFYALPGSTYNPNIWMRGIPNKTNLNAARSEPNVWITDTVNKYRADNQCYLYSPYFYTGFIKPDTLRFYMKSDLALNASLKIEYYSAVHKWLPLFDPESDTVWYKTNEGFKKGHLVAKNDKYYISMLDVERNIGNSTQLRFVFTVEPGAPVAEGVLIDNFELIRARQAYDVGVEEIIAPNDVTMGQSFRPEIRLKNYGVETVTSMKVEFACFGGNIKYVPRSNTWTGSLKSDSTTTYVFQQKDSFLVDKQFKTELLLCANTDMGSNDYFKDNDTAWKVIPIKPLQYDAGIEFKISPPDTVVINGSSDIIVRVWNYGQMALERIPIFLYNENTGVTTEGEVRHPQADSLIKTNMFVDYKFPVQYNANYGSAWLKVFTSLTDDGYHMNDTLRMKIRAVNNVADLVADHIYLDESRADSNVVTFAFTNKGDAGITDIPVVFFYDNDTVREVYTATTVGANATAYHTFATKLPKRTESYAICAFTNLDGEIDRLNDTTCKYEDIKVDMEAVYMNVEEQTDKTDCKLQLVAVNKGNYPVTSTTLSVMVEGTKLLSETLTDRHIAPGDTVRVIFAEKIAKKDNHTYSLVGTVTTNADINRRNDTTLVYNTVPFLVGIDDIGKEIAHESLHLGQNYPNPFEQATTIPFYLPAGGAVHFFVYDVVGKTIFETTRSYTLGEHSYVFKHQNLPSGIYYYGIEFNKERLVKKMVVK